jgi:hypothetical protein
MGRYLDEIHAFDERGIDVDLLQLQVQAHAFDERGINVDLLQLQVQAHQVDTVIQHSTLQEGLLKQHGRLTAISLTMTAHFRSCLFWRMCRSSVVFPTSTLVIQFAVANSPASWMAESDLLIDRPRSFWVLDLTLDYSAVPDQGVDLVPAPRNPDKRVTGSFGSLSTAWLRVLTPMSCKCSARK